MTNNDILRRIRYNFDFNDDKMISLFEKGSMKVTRSEVSNWMKKEEDDDYQNLNDFQLASFLNGFIVEKRGKKDGKVPVAEKKLNNNIILRKLKIALNYRDEEMLSIFKLADMRISKHELSSFFRNPKHQHYRLCKDQFLRNFIYGLQLKYRPE